MINLADGFKAWTDEEGLTKAMGVLLGVSATVGAVGGAKRAAGAGVGIAAVGTGLAGFVAALAVADFATSWVGADGANFKNLSKNLVDGLQIWADSEEMIALLAGGAAFGVLASATGGSKGGTIGNAFNKVLGFKAMLGGITGLMVIGIKVFQDLFQQ